MIFIGKLQMEIDQLIQLNSKYPNVIQPDKIENILAGWENIKARPEEHEHTSSMDIFKRELKGCIAMLENQESGSPQQRTDEGANINNLQARLSRISSNAKIRPQRHPMEEEPVLPATQPTPLSEQANSVAEHTALSEQAATYGQIHPMEEGPILPATQPTRPAYRNEEPVKHVPRQILKHQPIGQPAPPTFVQNPKPVETVQPSTNSFQMNPTVNVLSDKERDIAFAKELKQKYELELRTLVDQGVTNSDLLKEKSTIIKSLELLIMNLSL